MLTTFQSCHTTLPISFLVSLLPYPHTVLIQAAPLNLSGLSWWLRVKNLPATAGDSGLIPGSGRFPGEEGNDNPLQYSYLGNLMTRGTCQAAVRGVAKIRTRLSNWAPTRVCARAHAHTHTHMHTHTHHSVYLKQHSKRRGTLTAIIAWGHLIPPQHFTGFLPLRAFFQSHLILVWNLEAVGFSSPHCCKY